MILASEVQGVKGTGGSSMAVFGKLAVQLTWEVVSLVMIEKEKLERILMSAGC